MFVIFGLVLRVMWIGLAGGIANTIPPMVSRIFPYFSQPVDLHKKIGGKRIFGDHKTFRGFIFGVLSSHLVFTWQYYFVQANPESYLSSIAPEFVGFPIYFGALMGFASLGGDALKSFVKRRFDIAPGRPWPPFDQIDWVLGILVALAFFIDLSLIFVFLALLIGIFLHIVTKIIGYFLKINESYI